MQETYTPIRVSGALLIQACCAAIAIAAATFYNGYVAIILGMMMLALFYATRLPDSPRDRTIVLSLAIISIGSGVHAIALGVLARFLARLLQAG